MRDDQGYKKPRSRLRSKLMLGIVVVQCLLMAAILLVVEQRMRRSILDEFSKRGLSIAKNLAAVNTPYIATYNYVNIEQSVEHVKEENGLLYAIVLFYDGEVATYRGPEHIRGEVLSGAFQQRAVESQEPLVQYGVLGDAEVCDITVPIFLKEDKWGTVRSGFEMRDMHDAVLRTRQSLLVLCFMGLLGGCLAALYFARRITRPIGTLVESVEAISNGNYEHSIRIDSNDEIGFFGRRFIAMQETIKEHIQLLTETNLELTASNEKLQREILERERAEKELVKAKEAAEAASMSKSQFLANMSHEIRTPMNGVLGMTELLLNTDLSDKQKKFAEMAYISAESLLKIVNDILDLSKIEAGKLDLEIVHFDLWKTIQETVDLLDGQARTKGLELGCSISPHVPSALCGDPLRIKQILTNLIGNAIKFTSRGLVSVQVRVDKDWTDQALIRFEIIDTGIGISPEAKERIFDAFSQADGSCTRKYGGTGLGLSIAKELVHKMGGRIGVESETGKGSTFWFTACFRKQAGAHAALSTQEVVPGLDPEEDPAEFFAHVLLAEDNPVNQQVAKTMLESLGCSVHVVENGSEALEALSKSDYDIVLMDCQMPVMDGYEATGTIRRAEALAHESAEAGEHGSKMPVSSIGSAGSKKRRMPIIALTAHAGQSDREQCLAAGMDDFLSKPFTLDDLTRMLQRWLPKKPEVGELHHLIKSIQVIREVMKGKHTSGSLGGRSMNAADAIVPEESDHDFTRLEEAYLSCIKQLVNLLELKNEYRQNHSVRVADICMRIGKRMNMSEQSLEVLRNAALLHDLGHIGIVGAASKGSGPVPCDDWKKVKIQPLIVEELLGISSALADESKILRHHHERENGSGYPNGLLGKQLTLAQKILGVADAYVAMSSRRSHRDALDTMRIRDEFQKSSGNQFDEAVVGVLLQILKEEGTVQGNASPMEILERETNKEDRKLH